MQPIYVNTTIQNGKTQVHVRAIVDTGSDFLVVPLSLKKELGVFQFEETLKVTLADGRKTNMLRCYPVVITIEGFKGVGDEIIFGEGPDVLLGHWPLQKAKAIVDEVHHRLTHDPTPYLCVGCRNIWDT